jgi:hypothetical protein
VQELKAGRDAARAQARDPRSSEAIYTRGLPGGGEVHLELLVSDRGDIAGEKSRGRLVIDDRAAEPVIVEEIEGPDRSEVVDELFRIAQDNAAIARRLLRRYPARRGISI